MFHQRQWVGMAEDHRPTRGRHDVQAATPPGVGTVHQNARLVDGLHHLMPQRRQALLHIMAAACHAVVAVVGQVNLAHAQALVQGYHVGLLQQRHGALKVKADGDLALGLGPLDVLDAARLDKAVWLCRNTGPKAGNGLHDLRERVHVHANIDRHIVHTSLAKALNRRKTSLRMQGQAGVGFPMDHGDSPVRRKPVEASIRLRV